MVDRAVALEALGAACNATITPAGFAAPVLGAGLLGAVVGVIPQLFINNFIPTVLAGERTCSVSLYNSARIQDVLQGTLSTINPAKLIFDSTSTSRSFVINEKEFFDPDFDYDFRGRTDTKTYYRGGEEYTRPSGWYRFALKVLDKYDDNTWLGNRDRTTESVAGEWPVSYHGTTVVGARGIIKGNYKPGARVKHGKENPRQVYGNGVYSTPDLSEAEGYAKQFTSKTNGKTYKVVLQNRINPKYREKHNNDLYWLVPIDEGTPEEELLRVQRAIRPYGLLVKEV